MATVAAAMAALAMAVTATLAASHRKNISSHHSTDPRTAANALRETNAEPTHPPKRSMYPYIPLSSHI